MNTFEPSIALGSASGNREVREIALAFGVPPLLLGLPGDSTLANHAEANRAFWRLTVIPLVSRSMRAVAAWLAPAWGEALRWRSPISTASRREDRKWRIARNSGDARRRARRAVEAHRRCRLPQ